MPGPPGDAIAARQPVPLADQHVIQDAPAGKRASRHRRGVLVMVGAGLLVPVAVIVVGAIASSPRSSRPSASPVRELTEDQLRPGDCLRGSDLGLGTSSVWPADVMAVPCTQRHIAEVFFAGNAWPQSLAYPGDEAIGNQGNDRCASVLTAYIGSIKYVGVLGFDLIAPDRATWRSGDRLLVCFAYRADLQSVNYSFKRHYH